MNRLWNFATMAASMALRRSATQYFVFPHGMMDPWVKRTYPRKHLAKQAFWLFNEGPLLANAQAVLFTTEEERLLARQSFWSNRYRELVVGYGTGRPPAESPAQHAAFRAITPALAGRPHLLFLSRIHPKKGCDVLVEAFAKIAKQNPEIDLVIAGPDQEGQVRALQARADRLGVARRIHWPGMLQGDAKWGAFRGAEAFILPYHQESFGIVVAEALACGKPVLITDKVNIWREVAEWRAGLVASDTSDGVCRLLQDWLATTAQQRTTMQAAAVRLFGARFDVDVTADRLMETIARELGRDH